MSKKNPHIGSSFESWLDEQGLRREVTAAAIKAVKQEQKKLDSRVRGNDRLTELDPSP